MGPRRGASSSSVGFLVVVLVVGCTPNRSFAPSDASPGIVAPSSTKSSTTPPSPPTTSASASTIPTGPSAAWIGRSVDEGSGYAAGLAATGQTGSLFFHVLVSEEEVLDNGLDAEVYLRSRDAGRTWGERRVIRDRIQDRDGGPARLCRWLRIPMWWYRCGAKRRRRSHPGLVRAVVSDAKRGLELGVGSRDRCRREPRVRDFGRPRDERDVVVWSSHDHARTWNRNVLGNAGLDDCCTGPLKVTASDALVAVAWTDAGVTMTSISSNGGRDWGEATRLSIGSPTSASARGLRA